MYTREYTLDNTRGHPVGRTREKSTRNRDEHAGLKMVGRQTCKVFSRLRNNPRNLLFSRCYSNINEEITHFGYETVTKEEKTERGAYFTFI